MAVSLTINGTAYSFPSTGEAAGWGTAVTNWATAATSGMLQKAGGSFTLTADVDFGATYGLKAAYYKSRNASVSSTGIVRLANTERVAFRNNADDGDLALGPGTDDLLEFGGVDLADISTAQTLTNKSIDSDNNTITNIVNADIKAAAAIAVNKLAAVTASRALVSDGSGFVSPSAVTATELGYVSGVTSAIQTQLTTNAGAASTVASDLATHEALTIAHGATGAVVGETNTQTLTNKTLTSPTVNAGALSGTFSGTPTFSGNQTYSSTGANTQPSGTTAQRPGSPAEGMFRHNSDAGQFEGYTNGAWGAIGGASGGINYIADSDAESGVGDWAAYADAAAATPADGTGGSPTTTWTSQSGTVLRGSNSFKLLLDAANRQGEGAGYAFTLDSADKNKILKISFDFDASDANYVASDVGVYVYDVTNTTVISPSLVNLPGGSGKFEATFVSTDSTSYRLILHVQTTNASGYSLYFDNFLVGPETAFVAAPVGDWESYTPTGGWTTNTTYTGQYRRVGSSIEVMFDASLAGAPNSANFSINLPSGLTLDTTAMPNLTGSAIAVGSGTILDSGTRGYPAVIFVEGSSLVMYCAETTGSSASSVNQANPITFGSADNVSGHFSVPISEWSGSGVAISSARVEYASNFGSSATTSDTSSFSYGMAGEVIGTITSALNRRVRFQTPLQPSDVLTVELSTDQVHWFPADNGFTDDTTFTITPWTLQGANTYGMGALVPVNTTDVDIKFGKYSQTTTTYAGTGTAWSAAGGANYWRVRKSSPNAPAGIQQATSSVPGLVYASSWVAFTPTTNNTVPTWSVSPNGFWRRVGDSMEIKASMRASGGTGSGAVEVNMPTGYVIDTDKQQDTVGGFGCDGFASYRSSGATYTVNCLATDSTTFKSIAHGGASFLAWSDIDAANDSYSFCVTVPIVGWS